MHSKSITAYLVCIFTDCKNTTSEMRTTICTNKTDIFNNENPCAEIAAVTVPINLLMHFLSKLEMSNIFLCLVIAKKILYHRLNLLIIKTAALGWKLQWYNLTEQKIIKPLWCSS